MGANCAGAPIPTLQDNLLNHYHVTSLMYYHEYLGNQTAALGVPYVLGETNSISVSINISCASVFSSKTKFTLFSLLIRLSCDIVPGHAQHLRRLRIRTLGDGLRPLQCSRSQNLTASFSHGDTLPVCSLATRHRQRYRAIRQADVLRKLVCCNGPRRWG